MKCSGIESDLQTTAFLFVCIYIQICMYGNREKIVYIRKHRPFRNTRDRKTRDRIKILGTSQNTRDSSKIPGINRKYSQNTRDRKTRDKTSALEKTRDIPPVPGKIPGTRKLCYPSLPVYWSISSAATMNLAQKQYQKSFQTKKYHNGLF